MKIYLVHQIVWYKRQLFVKTDQVYFLNFHDIFSIKNFKFIDSTNGQINNSKNLSNSFSALPERNNKEPNTGRSYIKHVTKDLIRDIL
jgi:hypothetical protein